MVAASATRKEDLVFLFEDDLLLSNLIADELREVGYGVESCPDISGVELVKDLNPILIILDLSLDHTDAVEVLQALDEVGSRCPVQLISGSRPEMLDRVKAIGERRGMDMLPVLQKPFALADLHRVLDETKRSGSVRDRTHAAKPWTAGETRVDLGLALDKGWVEIWYQPKFEMAGLTLIGAECLCRVRHPDHGVLGPGAFLPQATLDDMRRLTESLLRQSCEDWTLFAAAGRTLRLALNIPCALLTTMPLAKLLRQWRPTSPDWPGLTLEVTEEQALQDIDAAHEIGTQLAIYGVDLSIDDFGTGYSSLARLREIPFKEIKLDRTLVHGCVKDGIRAALCRAIIELSHALGSATVAEGVEQVEDLNFLRDAGCDTAQGFLLARPMTRDALLSLIRSGTDLGETLGLDLRHRGLPGPRRSGVRRRPVALGAVPGLVEAEAELPLHSGRDVTARDGLRAGRSGLRKRAGRGDRSLG